MRFLLWLIALAGAVGIAVAWSLAHNATDGTVVANGDMPAILTSALLLWPIAAALLLLAVLRATRLLWTRYGSVFGSDSVARLLSAGIVAFIFSETLGRVIFDLATVLSNIFSRIPAALEVRWQAGEGLPTGCIPNAGASVVSQCLGPAISDMLSIADTYLALPQLVSSLDFGTLIFAFAVWALLGQFLSSSSSSAAVDSAIPRWKALVGNVRVQSRAGLSNFWLAITIGAGAMLAASAIIAIPLISDSVPLSDKEIAEAQAAIDASFPDQMVAKQILQTSDVVPPDTFSKILANYKDTPPEGLSSVGAEAARSPLAKTPSGGGAALPLNNQMKPTPGEAQLQLQATLDIYAKDSMDQARSFWEDTRASLLRQIDETKATAHQLIAKQNLVLTNARSKAGYIVDVNAWVERSRDTIFSRATSCRTAVDELKQTFANNVDQMRQSANNPQAAIYSPLAARTDFFLVNRQYCIAFPGDLTAPEAASLPVLGAFSFATWLIKLGSISLTLVAGMLGFGLLGAAISSIIRESRVRQAGEPLVKDLVSVAIRGMSATVVVYLAAKGGLAIIAGGAAPEPNSYVLLLTCFVASVFGDDVWVSTRKWFQGRELPIQNASHVRAPPAAGGATSAAVADVNPEQSPAESEPPVSPKPDVES